jgi:hypothetical protein
MYMQSYDISWTRETVDVGLTVIGLVLDIKEQIMYILPKRIHFRSR